MSATKPPSGSAGGGGGNVPLVTWMLGLDASGALDGLKSIETSAAETFDKLKERAQAMFPKSPGDTFAKAVRGSMVEAAKDVAAIGFAGEKAFDKLQRAADAVNFGKLKANLDGIDEKIKKIDLGRVQGAINRREAQAGAASTLMTMGGIGLGVGALYTRGLISQGNAISGIGQVQGFYQEQLARSVAGIFAPITAENIGRMAEFTGWLKRMDGAQQEAVRSLGMFVTTTAGLLYVLPKASSAMATMLGASAGVSRAFGIAGAVAAGIFGAMSATPRGREALTDIAKAFEPAAESLLRAAKELRPAVDSFASAISGLARNRGVQTALAGGATLLGDAPFALTGAAIGIRGGPIPGLAGMAIGSLGDAFTHGNAGSNVIGSAAVWMRQGMYGETAEQAERNVSRNLHQDFGFLPNGVRTFLFGRRAGDQADSDSSGRSELRPMAHGFEAVTDTWERLNAAAQTMELAQRTADNTGSAAADLAAIKQMMLAQGQNAQRGHMAGKFGPAVVD